jgi:dihydrofolate reductase
MLMSIAGFVPLPSDALVTPVTFRVRRRHLRGILAEFDSLETGSRELSGEWVVGKKTWQRLQSEWKASKKSKEDAAESPIGPKTPAKKKERVILYIHGGEIIPL